MIWSSDKSSKQGDLFWEASFLIGAQLTVNTLKVVDE